MKSQNERVRFGIENHLKAQVKPMDSGIVCNAVLAMDHQALMARVCSMGRVQRCAVLHLSSQPRMTLHKEHRPARKFSHLENTVQHGALENSSVQTMKHRPGRKSNHAC
jgi:hypothetical protein